MPKEAKMTIATALEQWQRNDKRNPDGKAPEEATVVKLFSMNPPLHDMDGSTLNKLRVCEHLALSTNLISKIEAIGGMERIRILSLARNNITKIENLESVSGTLQQLWLSYNGVATLNGLERLKQLRVLAIANNKIKKWDEIEKLKALPLLAEVVLKGNPVMTECPDGDIGYAKQLLHILPQLQKIDGIPCTKWRARIDEHHTSKLKGLFDRIDLDRGGTITANEMSKVLKGDDEMRKILAVEKGKEAALFAEMDEDGGGDISWDEFLLFFSQRLNKF